MNASGFLLQLSFCDIQLLYSGHTQSFSVYAVNSANFGGVGGTLGNISVDTMGFKLG